MRSADGLAKVDVGTPAELDGLFCEYVEKLSHFLEPLASSWMAVIAGTTSFSMFGPKDLVEDVGLIFDLSCSPSTLGLRSVLTGGNILLSLDTFLDDEALVRTTGIEGWDFFGVLNI